MSATYNRYTDEMKRNIVAVSKSGISLRSLARRFGVPPMTVSRWVRNPLYHNVGPAGKDLLEALPPDPIDPAEGFLRVPDSAVVPVMSAAPRQVAGSRMRITCGKLAFESEGFTPEEIGMIIRALGEADVL